CDEAPADSARAASFRPGGEASTGRSPIDGRRFFRGIAGSGRSAYGSRRDRSKVARRSRNESIRRLSYQRDRRPVGMRSPQCGSLLDLCSPLVKRSPRRERRCMTREQWHEAWSLCQDLSEMSAENRAAALSSADGEEIASRVGAILEDSAHPWAD